MQPAIRVANLAKSFGPVRAVRGIDLSVQPGEAFCFLGPNGAGKSTAINMMLGLSRPDTGEISVFGHAPDSRAARILTGYTAQDSDFPANLKVGELLEMVRRHYPDPRPASELLEQFGLDALQDRFAGGLSGGQRRRLGLAMAFAGNGRLVFLDEPTTGLDSSARKAFWDYATRFRDSGGALLITTHHLEEIETIADHICLINHGRIQIEGGVDEIRARLGQKFVHFNAPELPDLSPVTEVSEENGRFEVMTPDADALVRALVQSGVTFHDLEIRSASLEQAIDELTRMEGAQ